MTSRTSRDRERVKTFREFTVVTDRENTSRRFKDTAGKRRVGDVVQNLAISGESDVREGRENYRADIPFFRTVTFFISRLIISTCLWKRRPERASTFRFLSCAKTSWGNIDDSLSRGWEYRPRREPVSSWLLNYDHDLTHWYSSIARKVSWLSNFQRQSDANKRNSRRTCRFIRFHRLSVARATDFSNVIVCIADVIIVEFSSNIHRSVSTVVLKVLITCNFCLGWDTQVVLIAEIRSVSHVRDTSYLLLSV